MYYLLCRSHKRLFNVHRFQRNELQCVNAEFIMVFKLSCVRFFLVLDATYDSANERQHNINDDNKNSSSDEI